MRSRVRDRWSDHNAAARVGGLVAGILLVFQIYSRFPRTRPILEWSVPALLVLWGVSRLYIARSGDVLTLVAGCLLLLGGITRASHLSLPMTEFQGTVANFVPALGIVAELFTSHYRDE